ncbi:CopG family transcriptional regulator [Alcanivorax xiamenensis]|uniref:Antitoxin ParD n=1 Tax=Alcanivorax xiamenensis TaxID=1177156 RepID=A0ABQ6Y6N5_9GAMM|nr:type II toxin-antitoxin system ParD family antitoxin [Alcanivorax xiamenensis]KAF0804621.1 CopG family transcriptional regulator [Alcanivorax xiamenensis]
MHVSLTPELEARIKAKVDSGLYNNASEVVREALRFVETHEEWVNELKLARLREQLQEGILPLNQGQGIRVDSKAGLDRLFDDIKTG